MLFVIFTILSLFFLKVVVLMSIKWFISDIDYIIWLVGTVNTQKEHELSEIKNRFNVNFISRKI